MRQFCVTLLIGIMVFFFGTNNTFAAYPERPITLIIGFGAGGVTDILGRSVAQLMAQEMGGNIIVKNVPGGGGTLAAAELARAKGDGYTLGYLPVGTMASQPHLRSLPYKWDAFTPIALVSDNPVTVVSTKNAPWKDFPGAIEELKANPNKYFFTSSSPGGSPHVSQQALFDAIGVKINHMPSKDSGSAILALQSGTVHFYADPPVIIKHFDLVGLGVFTDKRVDTFPDVPTFKEMGIDVPNFSGWHALWAPPELSQDVLEKLEKVAQKAILSPEFAEICKRTDMTVSYMNKDDFSSFFSDQYELYGKYIKQFGLKK